jgi:hypothetical protein
VPTLPGIDDVEPKQRSTRADGTYNALGEAAELRGNDSEVEIVDIIAQMGMILPHKSATIYNL